MSRRDPALRRSPEFELIGKLRERFAATAGPRAEQVRIGIGDDAAVTVPPPGSGEMAVSVDGLVEGFGFRRSWCPPRAAGAKALGAALSDLAAMGARAGEAYIWVGMPAGFGSARCLELAEGIAALATEHGVAILGGDLTSAPALAVTVTAIGYGTGTGTLVGRAGARPGDILCATGSFGGAAAGLLVLEDPGLAGRIPAPARRAATARQLGPVPQLAAGMALAAAGARAMIDVSDGLGAECEHLAAASGLGIEVDLERVPLAPGVAEVAAAAGREPASLAAAGGEDYELLCALPPAVVEEARAAVAERGSRLTEIGRFLAGEGARINFPDGHSESGTGHDSLPAREAPGPG